MALQVMGTSALLLAHAGVTQQCRAHGEAKYQEQFADGNELSFPRRAALETASTGKQPDPHAPRGAHDDMLVLPMTNGSVFSSLATPTMIFCSPEIFPLGPTRSSLAATGSGNYVGLCRKRSGSSLSSSGTTDRGGRTPTSPPVKD